MDTISISKPFIERPVAASLLMAAIFLLGLLGYQLLPVSALPSVNFPTIEVTTQYPGAGPAVMASLVTTPLERQLGQISGLSSMVSSSSYGVSDITLRFDLGRNIDNAAQDVQSAINATKGILPSNLPYPPVYHKVNPADAPILTLAVTSRTMPLYRVNDLVDTLLAQKLSQVSGVGLVTIEGNQKPAVRVQVNPAVVASLGLSLEDVRAALMQANVNAPKGSFSGPLRSYTIASNDQIRSARAYSRVVIAYENGAPVRLSDVAKVLNGAENDQLAAWADGKPAILIDVRRQPGANIVATADAVKTLLPRLTSQLPRSIHLRLLSDRTRTIKASVRDVQFTLLLTGILVVMVMFLFLRKLWATVIPSVVLPLSLVGTFGVMALCGFSIDNFSLMALTVATGFVVDDAIVMIENIVRYIEQGKSPHAAALLGAKQIGFTVVSLTVSLIAVFIPLLLMPGLVGRLFREFALVLSIAVVLSAFISLTLTPMMCSKLLRAENRSNTGGRLFRWSERVFAGTLAAYGTSLHWVLRHRFAVLMLSVATLGATVLLYLVVPKGLLPEQDTGLLIGTVQAPESISFSAMRLRTERLAATIRNDIDVQSVSAFVGAGTVNPTLNQGQLSIVLKPRSARNDSLARMISRIGHEAAEVPGLSLYLHPVQDVEISSTASRTQYQYVLRDTDAEQLDRWTPRLVNALMHIPLLADVSSDLQTRGLQLHLRIHRNMASRLGVSMQAIDDTLYDAFGQRQITTIYTQSNEYRVVMGVPPAFRDSPGALSRLYVNAALATPANSSANPNANSAPLPPVNVTSLPMVPLAAVVSARIRNGPLVVMHREEMPAATVSFNLAKGASLSEALPAIRLAQARIGFPTSIETRFTGAALQYERAVTGDVWLILAALVVIYIVLGVLYESYIHPITILSTLPSAGVGALLALLLTGKELTIVSMVGIVLLIGIVKKNAILMIDFALDAERREGALPEHAIVQACLLRFRPIMMTTMAALLGAFPLALQSGTGSELRKPLGIAIVGGLLLSQWLTLYTTPVIYLYMDRWARGLRFWISRTAARPIGRPAE